VFETDGQDGADVPEWASQNDAWWTQTITQQLHPHFTPIQRARVHAVMQRLHAHTDRSGGAPAALARVGSAPEPSPKGSAAGEPDAEPVRLLLPVRVPDADSVREGEYRGVSLGEAVPLAVTVRDGVAVGVGVLRYALDSAPPGLMSARNSPDAPTPAGSSRWSLNCSCKLLHRYTVRTTGKP
jgi:hypothetical protein